MTSIKNTGRILGALFLAVMLTWGAGYALMDPLLTSPDYLNSIHPNQTTVTIGVLFELIEVAGVLAITFLIFPLIKKYRESWAIGYVGFRIFESIMLITALICPLLLVNLSHQFIAAGSPNASHFQTLGVLLVELRNDWSLYILAFFHPLAALILYYFLYATKLVPRWLSIWGFLAGVFLLFDQVILESFGLGLGRVGGNPISGIPMGLNEIVLGIWLMVIGFNDTVAFVKKVV